MSAPWRIVSPLEGEAWRSVRRQTIFQCCKWDPQVEDTSALTPQPLIIARSAWHDVSELARQLAQETLAAEAEVLRRPELHSRLGLPRAVRKVLRAVARHGGSSGIARVMRFDFHFTDEGWRLSEVNSDVPGGFIESSGFTRLVAAHFPQCSLPGNPAHAYAAAVRAAMAEGALVGLVYATSYTDDGQVMTYLAQDLESLGLSTRLLSPDQLQWRNGRAWSIEQSPAEFDFLIRFYPGEWLANLPHYSGWQHFFTGGKTPLSNPAGSLVTQSKRFPLVWDELSVTLPTWRKLLPQTCHPRDVDWQGSHQWVLKPALGRVGEDIALPGVTPEKHLRQIARHVRWFPRAWVAQRRFKTLALKTAAALYPCLGVFTIDDAVVGAYGRLASDPLINYKAQDAAVLIAAE